jgi:Lon protease-like protein
MFDKADLQIPEVVPAMTLNGVVFFPQAVMPLYIFEERYRKMLRDVLSGPRLFALFNENADERESGIEEPPHRMGTVGVVRAAHKNPDGTSNLALQGISRVRLLEITHELPYRQVRVEICETENDASPENLPRKSILDLIEQQPSLSEALPEEYFAFMKSLEEPDPFIDVSIQAVCQHAPTKQKLLETLSLKQRYIDFEKYLLKEKARADLFRSLQGDTRDDEIDLN